MSKRLPYLDNLKVVLVCGVIALHVAITYGFDGSWYLESYDEMSRPLVVTLTVVLGAGWLFGLGLFFLIAGRLSEPSLARKGPAAFARDRTLRLGVPLVIYTLLASPVLEYVDYRVNRDGREPFWEFVRSQVWSLAPGPTWFLEALLALSLGYALWRWATRSHKAPPVAPMAGQHVAAAALTIAVTSFIAHFAFPVGEEQFHLQLGMFPQYVVMFALGATAARRGWLESLSPALQRRCGLAGLAALALLIVLFWVGDFFDNDAAQDRFAGGLHWQAAGGALVEGVMAVCVSLWAVGYFRRRFNTIRPPVTWMSPAAYGAFIIHPPIIVGLALAIQPTGLPAELKFLTVLSAGIFASFGLAALVLGRFRERAAARRRDLMRT